MNVVETKIIDGELFITEYQETWQVNKNIAVDDIFPTDNISYINFQTTKDNVVKLYKDIHISTISISHGTPSYLLQQEQTNSPPSKKCGGCPGR
jgi:hypothetical protein